MKNHIFKAYFNAKSASFNFRYDIDLPMLLDYEIWKASHMLFQKFPYNEDDSLDHEEGEESDPVRDHLRRAGGREEGDH